MNSNDPKRSKSKDEDRQPQLGEQPKKPKHGGQQHAEGGDPRTLPGSQDLGDQSEPQDKGGMVKGT